MDGGAFSNAVGNAADSQPNDMHWTTIAAMPVYRPSYGKSHALVIGINDYLNASPLQFARNDAEAVADTLIKRFEFATDNVVTLYDDEAKREAILQAYHDFSQDGTEDDDRLIVFFAGHGHTLRGIRGEVGHLVPWDGDTTNSATLVRWSELTGNAELIRAKHIFFIMDACYGGLAISRGLAPGASRMVRDMMQRMARQVLTAGKANQPVSDAGGPLPEHSVFTGHLLQGMEGLAASGDGIITANGLMAYVYQRVGSDYESRQTPHYGFVDGDGDFILHWPGESTAAKGDDVFVEVPSVVAPTKSETESIIARVKALIPDQTQCIELDDLIVRETRNVLALLTPERFPMNGKQMLPETIAERLKTYESDMRSLRSALAVLGCWGRTEHQNTARKAVSRLLESLEHASGMVGWLSLRFYPSLLCTYSLGMGAMAGDNYAMLYAVLTPELSASSTSRVSGTIVNALGEGILEINQADLFKVLTEHQRHYVPRSEYMFRLLQPEMDDLLFLGNAYESLFDAFELFLALVYFDLGDRGWAPLGRFGWKYNNRFENHNLLSRLLDEANAKGSDWPPIQAGFFGGTVERFKTIAASFEDRMLKGLEWR